MDAWGVLGQVLGVLAEQMVRALSRAPHLSVFPVLFWATVAAGLYLRYARGQRTRSQDLLRLTPVIGVLAVVVAAIDLAVRGQVEVVHPSLVAYLAVPLGAGRRALARLDGLAATRHWRHSPNDRRQELRYLGQRQLTYVVALLLYMVLAAIAGEPYRLGSRPALDGNDPSSLAAVNWLHLAAFLFTLAIALDPIVTATQLARSRRSPEQ